MLKPICECEHASIQTRNIYFKAASIELKNSED